LTITVKTWPIILCSFHSYELHSIVNPSNRERETNHGDDVDDDNEDDDYKIIINNTTVFVQPKLKHFF